MRAPTPKFPESESATDSRTGHGVTPPRTHLVVHVPPILVRRDAPTNPRGTRLVVPAGRVGLGGRMRRRRRLYPGDPASGSWTKVFRGRRERAHAWRWRGGGACAERGTRAAHAQWQAAALAELGDGGGGGGGAERVRVAREPPARAQCDPDPARPPARHGQRGQPGGRRWRRAAAARRLRPRPGPRCREAAFSTGRRRTAPGDRRGAGDRRTSGSRPRAWGWPGQVSARHSSLGRGQEGTGVCSLRRRPVLGPTTLRSSLDSEVGRPAAL